MLVLGLWSCWHRPQTTQHYMLEGAKTCLIYHLNRPFCSLLCIFNELLPILTICGFILFEYCDFCLILCLLHIETSFNTVFPAFAFFAPGGLSVHVHQTNRQLVSDLHLRLSHLLTDVTKGEDATHQYI